MAVGIRIGHAFNSDSRILLACIRVQNSTILLLFHLFNHSFLFRLFNNFFVHYHALSHDRKKHWSCVYNSRFLLACIHVQKSPILSFFHLFNHSFFVHYHDFSTCCGYTIKTNYFLEKKTSRLDELC